MSSDGPAHCLLAGADIRDRIDELGSEIAADLQGPEPPLLVGVLKGCTLFLADLVRAMPIDVHVDFMAISSYAGSTGSSGVVRILKDVESDIRDRDVLIVEDIVDTGLTLTYLRRNLQERGARSLRTVTLLDKAVRRIVPVDVEYRGFEIDDVFVVGYGLDFQGRYRNVSDVLAVTDIARLANDPLLLVEPLWPAVKR